MSSAIPVLRTDRLILRGPLLTDFPDSLAMWREPAVTRFITGRPNTEEEAWARMLRYAGHWALLDFGYWVVTRAGDGAFLGELGFGDFRREICPALEDAPEMGWVLAPRAHGQGFAMEAGRAALAWRDAMLPGTSTICLINPAHADSLRVAGKLGFAHAREAVHRGEAVSVLRRSGPVGT